MSTDHADEPGTPGQVILRIRLHLPQCCSVAYRRIVRTVFTNGSIWTGTTESPAWVAVERSRIVSMGNGEPPGGERFDLDGRCVLPEFQDAHVHARSVGLQ